MDYPYTDRDGQNLLKPVPTDESCDKCDSKPGTLLRSWREVDSYEAGEPPAKSICTKCALKEFDNARVENIKVESNYL